MNIRKQGLSFAAVTLFLGILVVQSAQPSKQVDAAPTSEEQNIIATVQARANACASGDLQTWAKFVDPSFRDIEGNIIYTRQQLLDLCHNAARAIRGHKVERQASDFHFQFVGNIALVDYLYDFNEYLGEAVFHDPLRRFETFEKRQGKWVGLLEVSAEVIPDPPVVKVDGATLEAFVGEYAWAGSDFVDTVTRRGDKLYVQGTDQDSPTEVLPQTENTFFFRGEGVGHQSRVTFVRDQNGRVIEEHVFSPADGQGFSAKKVK